MSGLKDFFVAGNLTLAIINTLLGSYEIAIYCLIIGIVLHLIPWSK